MNVLHLFVLILMIFMSKVQASSLFDLFFGNRAQGGQRNSYNRRPKGRSYVSEGGYGDYRRICKVVNPDPYAFVGNNPYPGAPFCPP